MALDDQLLQHFRWHRFGLQIKLGHDPPDRLDRCLAGQRRQIGSDKTVGCAREFFQVNRLVQRHAAGVDAQNFAAPGNIRHTDDDLAVKTAGTAQGFVYRFGAVGRGDDHQIDPRFEPVHQSQQLRNQPLFGFALYLSALRRNRIDLVDKQDRRRGLGRFFKNLAQLLFGFAIGRPHDFGAVDQEKLGFAFIGHRAGEPRLARPRRTVQQHAAWRIDAQACEQLRIAQWQFDHFAELVDRFLQPADIVIGDIRAAMFG